MFLGTITSTIPWLTLGVGHVLSKGTEQRLTPGRQLLSEPGPRAIGCMWPSLSTWLHVRGRLVVHLHSTDVETEAHQHSHAALIVRWVSSESRTPGSLSPTLGNFHCIGWKVPGYSAGDICIHENLNVPLKKGNLRGVSFE